MFTILLNLTVSIMYTFDNMELKYELRNYLRQN